MRDHVNIEVPLAEPLITFEEGDPLGELAFYKTWEDFEGDVLCEPPWALGKSDECMTIWDGAGRRLIVEFHETAGIQWWQFWRDRRHGVLRAGPYEPGQLLDHLRAFNRANRLVSDELWERDVMAVPSSQGRVEKAVGLLTDHGAFDL